MAMTPAIEVNQLTKVYRQHQKEEGLLGSVQALFHRTYVDALALDRVCFHIEAGELVGLLGPNGAGKTTTLKLLSGLLYPSSGCATVLGYVPWRRDDDLRRQISLVSGQKNQLWWDLPALESFILHREIYGIPLDRFQQVLRDLSEMLDVGDLLKVPVRKLSLGERMKMELIGALLHTPRILFLDEPTVGLDLVAQQRIRDFIRTINAELGTTILITSHYMADIEAACRRVIVLTEGQIVYDGALSEIVQRFNTHKRVSVVFPRPVERDALAHLGTLEQYEPLRAIFAVERHDLPRLVREMMGQFEIGDLTVEEARIEDVFRAFFIEAQAA
jgi:ABC-2 type transport system ATP-binding protein